VVVVTARQQAALAEVEHAATSLRHDLFLALLSLDVMVAEAREALGVPVRPDGERRLIVVRRRCRS
jgi:hypothetical protein